MDTLSQMTSRHIPSEQEEQSLGAANAALKSATPEDIDRLLETMEEPEKRQEKEKARLAQEAREAHEITELERKNDEITSKFAQLLITDLIKLHPKLGESTPPESYTQLLNARYQDLTNLIKDRYKDGPAINVDGLALLIFSKTLEVLNASQSLDTAKRIFMTQHHFEGATSREEDPSSGSKDDNSQFSETNIISNPLASSTSFAGHTENIQAKPAMFSLKDLGLEVHDAPIQPTSPQDKKEQN